jgi:hypothetical protein
MHESSKNPFMPDITTKTDTMEWKNIGLWWKWLYRS